MLAGALVDDGIKLEVDLIHARGEMDGQRLTEAAGRSPVGP